MTPGDMPSLGRGFRTLGTLADLPAGGISGSIEIAQYPGSRLYWDGAKYGGDLGKLTVANGGIDATGMAIAASGAALAVGTLAIVPNPCVPMGWSRVLWNGALFAPPPGELIVSAARGSSRILDFVLGSLVRTVVWSSAIIPDYMLPTDLVMEIKGEFGISNSAGVAGAGVGVGISRTAISADPATAGYLYPMGRGAFAPSPAGDGFSIRSQFYASVSSPTMLMFNPFNTANARRDSALIGLGNTKAQVVVKCSKVDDTVVFDTLQIVSLGNL